MGLPAEKLRILSTSILFNPMKYNDMPAAEATKHKQDLLIATLQRMLGGGVVAAVGIDSYRCLLAQLGIPEKELQAQACLLTRLITTCMDAQCNLFLVTHLRKEDSMQRGWRKMDDVAGSNVLLMLATELVMTERQGNKLLVRYLKSNVFSTDDKQPLEMTIPSKGSLRFKPWSGSGAAGADSSSEGRQQRVQAAVLWVRRTLSEPVSMAKMVRWGGQCQPPLSQKTRERAKDALTGLGVLRYSAGERMYHAVPGKDAAVKALLDSVRAGGKWPQPGCSSASPSAAGSESCYSNASRSQGTYVSDSFLCTSPGGSRIPKSRGQLPSSAVRSLRPAPGTAAARALEYVQTCMRQGTKPVISRMRTAALSGSPSSVSSGVVGVRRRAGPVVLGTPSSTSTTAPPCRPRHAAAAATPSHVSASSEATGSVRQPLRTLTAAASAAEPGQLPTGIFAGREPTPDDVYLDAENVPRSEARRLSFGACPPAARPPTVPTAPAPAGQGVVVSGDELEAFREFQRERERQATSDMQAALWAAEQPRLVPIGYGSWR